MRETRSPAARAFSYVRGRENGTAASPCGLAGRIRPAERFRRAGLPAVERLSGDRRESLAGA